MKKQLLWIISLALAFGFLLAGCSRASAEEGDSKSVPAASALTGQSDTSNMQQASEGETDMSAQTYSTRETQIS